jgi:hypothetical protein
MLSCHSHYLMSGAAVASILVNGWFNGSSDPGGDEA